MSDEQEKFSEENEESLMEELDGLSVGQLKRKLRELSISTENCVEKSDLVQLLYQSLQSQSNVSCAICYTSNISAVHMPCCWKETSTIQFCMHCLTALCEQAEGKIGRCPTCRSYYKIDASNSQPVMCENIGRCLMCCQPNKVIVERNLCEGCLLGSRHQFRYECERCHQVQVIPHPMWRYQETPEVFGNVTWACHQMCGSYTHWRILPEDVTRVPHQECPESWGRREAWMASVRALSMSSQQGQGRPDEQSAGNSPVGSCLIS